MTFFRISTHMYHMVLFSLCLMRRKTTNFNTTTSFLSHFDFINQISDSPPLSGPNS